MASGWRGISGSPPTWTEIESTLRKKSSCSGLLRSPPSTAVKIPSATVTAWLSCQSTRFFES